MKGTKVNWYVSTLTKVFRNQKVKERYVAISSKSHHERNWKKGRV
jgi:hypothetical protein